MPQNSKGKRYRVRYDRIVFVLAILLVLILILTSCISSCSKKKDNGENPNSGTDSSSSKNDATNSSNSGENTNSLADPNAPTEAPKITYSTIELEYSDIHKGNLILANPSYPCEYNYEAIENGTSDEVDMTTIKSILDTKTEEFLHYTASDWVVGMDREAALAMDAWLEGFYAVSGNSDIRMIRGYDKESEDLDFRTGRTCTIGVYPATGSSYVYERSEELAWIQDNAHNYGFILRYPEEKEEFFDTESITTRTSGTFRYVGVAAATYISQSNLCLEEYLSTVKSYTIDNMLKIENGSTSYGVYYVPANVNGKTSLSVPSSGTPYEVSGNNMDGFIVTATLSGGTTAAPTPVATEPQTDVETDSTPE